MIDVPGNAQTHWIHCDPISLKTTTKEHFEQQNHSNKVTKKKDFNAGCTEQLIIESYSSCFFKHFYDLLSSFPKKLKFWHCMRTRKAPTQLLNQPYGWITGENQYWIGNKNLSHKWKKGNIVLLMGSPFKFPCYKDWIKYKVSRAMKVQGSEKCWREIGAAEEQISKPLEENKDPKAVKLKRQKLLFICFLPQFKQHWHFFHMI